MDLKLIIFDCDGVLVDTERISCTVFTECLVDFGLDFTFEDTIKTFKGLSEKDCVKIVAQLSGKDVPAHFIDRYISETTSRYETELKPIKGIVDVLDSIQEQICVASSGLHKKMQQTLSVTHLMPYFKGHIFSATEVKRGKPFPDLFLYAAKKMNIHPENCVVIEDSVPGVKAAVSAKMKVLGFADLTEASELQSAGAVTFREMAELPQLLKNL